MIDMIRYIMIYDISRYVVVNCMYSNGWYNDRL